MALRRAHVLLCLLGLASILLAEVQADSDVKLSATASFAASTASHTFLDTRKRVFPALGVDYAIVNNREAVRASTRGPLAPRTQASDCSNPGQGCPITLAGGPLLTGADVEVTLVWYGNWCNATTSEAKYCNHTTPTYKILTDFVQSLGESAWWGMTKTYYDSATPPNYIQGLVHKGNIAVPTNDKCAPSDPENLSDMDVAAITYCLLQDKQASYSPTSVFMVLTSSDINLSSGLCTRYCGWHNVYTYNDTSGKTIPVRFGVVGSPDYCNTLPDPHGKCVTTIGPNNNTEADGMVSVLGHELSEAASDPNLDAWTDAGGWENADKCAWHFGQTSAAGVGLANVYFKCPESAKNCTSRSYLIQEDFTNPPNGKCALAPE